MRKAILLTVFVACAMISLVLPATAVTVGVDEGTVRAKDGVPIAYRHYRNGCGSVIIVCPGFFNSMDNRWMRKTVEMLSPAYDVIAFDFRGHGRSGGRFMWSAREDADVEAVIGYARSAGYRHIGIVAYSLGAASAINAVAAEDGVESMVLISCPSRFDMIDFRFWEPEMFTDLLDNISCGWQGKGARWGNPFLGKKSPIDTVCAIGDTPLLFIHGDRDWIVKARHSQKLYDAAPGQKKLEIIKGGWHAEQLMEHQYEQMQKLIIGWFAETIGKG